MAHKGRLYPVHFRRDFNFQCDVSSLRVLPKVWTNTLSSGEFVPYIIDGRTFVCQEVAGPDDHTIAWLSPAAMYGIWLWQLRLHVSFWQLPDSDLQATWILQRDAIDVARWRGVQSDRYDPVNPGRLISWQQPFLDFTTFPHGGNFNNSRFGPVGY